MKKHIPIILIFSRLILGLLILFLSYINVQNFKTWGIICLVLGVLTDVFDGIIARKLEISTQTLRRLDSSIDQIFFFCTVAATYIQCPNFYANNFIKIVTLVASELLIYLVYFIKFKKEIATHSIGAKIWTLTLLILFIEILATCESTFWFELSFWLGILTRIEILSIILVLKHWTNDVPSIFHALKLRKGEEISRNKLFNG